MKKLYRSNTNKIFSGLLGGIGEYYDVDPVFIRLIFVALLVLTAVAPGIVIYILALFIVPRAPEREIIRDAEVVE